MLSVLFLWMEAGRLWMEADRQANEKRIQKKRKKMMNCDIKTSGLKRLNSTPKKKKEED